MSLAAKQTLRTALMGQERPIGRDADLRTTETKFTLDMRLKKPNESVLDELESRFAHPFSRPLHEQKSTPARACETHFKSTSYGSVLLSPQSTARERNGRIGEKRSPAR